MQANAQTPEAVELDAVSCHRHLCLLYGAEAELLAPVIPFMQKGVALGERCLYLYAVPDALQQVLKNALSAQKQDIGALRLVPLPQNWLQSGALAGVRFLELCRTVVADAVRDGFKGARIVCELGWAGRERHGLESLEELEVDLERFVAEEPVTVLCLYHRPSFSPERLLKFARAHRHLSVAGKVCRNPLYPPPEAGPPADAAARELELFLAMVQTSSSAAAERDRLRQELEQAYAVLARKIYETWQAEDTRKDSARELHDKDEAILAHKRRVQTVLQHLPAVLLAFDAAGSVAACNHEFERVAGFRAEEVMGRPIYELLPVEPAAREQLAAAHPPEGGDYRGLQWGLRCKDGSLKSVSWTNFSRYVPITGWSNWIVGLDETPLVEAEIGVRTLREELAARDEELALLERERAELRALMVELLDQLRGAGSGQVAVEITAGTTGRAGT